MLSRKICLIGDFGVGKTSLIRRFVDRQFSDQYLSTVGVKISRKQVELAETSGQTQQELQLIIWDLEGETRFKAIASNYLQGAKGAILVADVTRPETLENLTSHLQHYLSVNPQGSVLVALNKSDLLEAEALERVLDRARFSSESQVIGTFLTSAKTGANVDQLFQIIAQRFVKQST